VRRSVLFSEIRLRLDDHDGAPSPAREAPDEAAAEQIPRDDGGVAAIEGCGERTVGRHAILGLMMPETRSVLVTGGAGFIGSHLADAFLAEGKNVVILDDLSTGQRSRLPKGARFVEGDIRSFDLERLLDDAKVDTILHYAAQIDVRKSVEDPVFDAEVNVLGTIRIARAALAAGVSQIVFASSGGAIYGDPEGFAADENHPTNPVSPYGVAKLAGEKYLFGLSHGTPLVVTALRFANVYGPRQDGRGEAGVIGIWMKKLLEGGECLINGGGDQSRDFVFVGDVVKANLEAAARRITGVINIGTGVETSVNRLYDLVAAACGTSRPARRGPAKSGEQMRSVLDVTRSRTALGLSSLVELPEGLRRTAAWFRQASSPA
jgi:UDP-glucose 4-epimerase